MKKKHEPLGAAAAFGLLVLGPGVGALALDASPAWAALETKNYEIPPGPVATALRRFAEKSGAILVYDSELTRDKTTAGLDGAATINEGLARLLSGTGLSYTLAPGEKAVSIVLAQNDTETRNDASGATPLPAIDIGAEEGRPRATGRPGLGQGPGDRRTGYRAESAPTTLKFDAPLMKTPISVGVVTRQAMDDQQAISVGDALFTNVSGVTPSTAQLDVFKVRGFFNVLGNMYKNGLMEYRVRNLDTTNLQSIEVLKGPAAMEFGRGEPGGVIDLVVKRPLTTPYYSIQEQVTSYSGTRTTIDATGPLTEDKSLLYRVNGTFFRTDSYRNFVTDRNFFVAPTISYHPVEQFRINVDFEYQNRTWVDDYFILPAVGGAPATIPVGRYLSSASLMTSMPDHVERTRIAYDMSYEFLPGWSLTNRLSYSSMATRNVNIAPLGFDQATGVLSRYAFVVPGTTDRTFATNLDLKGKFQTGPVSHSILLGLDALKNYMPINLQYQPILSTINIYAPNSWQIENPYSNPVYSKSGQKWTGIYGQDMLSFFDDTVHLLLGGRFDWAETSNNKNLKSAVGAEASYVSTYNTAFSPRVGIVYQPQPWLSLYGNFTQSFGVANSTRVGVPLAPQKGEMYEGGLKAELLDKRLTLTMSYFDIFKTNVPYTDPTNANNTLLIGKARSQGFEFDLKGRIDDNWSVIANYTHDDVRTVEGASSYNPLTLITTQLAIAGAKLPGSPRNYGNLWVKYDADGELSGWSLGGGLTVVESALGDNANSFVLPGYTLVNGMIAYSTKIAGYTVTGQLNVKNIGDATYYQTAADRYTILTGVPRTFLGSLRLEF
ncbi:TonB-dependent receptor [Methylosinus sp. LW3]|uniref:TonB-dependent siderophore receptor n=2 Tax=unclassified Methylosinus TaxID=2624500 RepID=UPI0004638E97|nr:TonB-dependent receptor [Methylosinus sp. LW3]